MPLIEKGKVEPGVNGAPKLYGVEKTENTIPFQERMMRLFKPQEFVTIKNIDNEPVYWQYMPADNETENYSEDGMQRIINREAPEMWVIMPGDVEVIVGASAYRALDVMYKNYTAKSVLRKFKDPESPQFNEDNQHLPKNFNFADAGAQAAFLEKAFMGKATPTFGDQQVMPSVQPTEAPAAEQSTPVDDPTIPKPKTTEGAPLQPVTYAEPDAQPVKSAKELLNANSKK